MQSLSEAVAALAAQRERDEQAQQAELDRLTNAKHQREAYFAAAFAAHLQTREDVDLTSPAAEARVVVTELGNANVPHYEVSVCLRGGRVEPRGSAFLTQTTLPGTEWESRGWRACFGQNCWTDSATFMDACLAVYQNAPVAQDAEADV